MSNLRFEQDQELIPWCSGDKQIVPYLLSDFEQHVEVGQILRLLEVRMEQLLDHVALFALLVREANHAVRPKRVVNFSVAVEVDPGRLSRLF